MNKYKRKKNIKETIKNKMYIFDLIAFLVGGSLVDLLYSDWDIVKNNLDKDWNWIYLTQNENMTWDIIKNNLNFSWDWRDISRRMDFNIIESNPNMPWNWHWVSQNQNVTCDMIESNLNKPWSWIMLSLNKNINFDFINKHSKRYWDYHFISSNNMEKGKKIWIDNLRIKIIKALQIQRHWRNCISNPEFKLARKNIDYIFKKINS